MKGDFSRSKFKPEKYRNVRMQQGRIFLDSDWNEQIEIESRLCEIEAIDTFGRCGAPQENPGFSIAVSEEYIEKWKNPEEKRHESEAEKSQLKSGDFVITPGRYYVDGILCENDESVLYSEQIFGPMPIEEAGTYLAYLDLWERHISSIEDPEIREVALGGADTTTRTETIWQVKTKKIQDDVVNAGDSDCQAGLPPTGRGRMSTGLPLASGSKETLCNIAPRRGYRGSENRLYRVEIHDGGEPYGSSVSDTIEARKISLEDGESPPQDGKCLIIEIKDEADWKIKGLSWKAGQAVEIKSAEDDQSFLSQVLETIPAKRRLNLCLLEDDKDISEIDDDLQIRRVATFKWSRENGSVAFAVEDFNEDFVRATIQEPIGIKIESKTDWGLEGSVWKTGQTIEIFDDEGRDIKAAIVDVIDADRTLIVDEDLTDRIGQNPRIRRVVPAEGLDARRLMVKNEIDWAVDGGLTWLQGQVVEISSDNQKPLARITAVYGTERTLELDKDISSLGDDLYIRQVSGSNRVKVLGSGRDPLLSLQQGDWVEVTGDQTELRCEPGTLAQIEEVDEMDSSLSLSRNVYIHKGENHLKVRRWDIGPSCHDLPMPVRLGAGERLYIDLEDGIMVSFSGEDFRSGDYWTFRARASTGEIDLIDDELPYGIVHHYCGLAILEFSDGKLEVSEDCRRIYPSLTEMIELLQELKEKFYKLTNLFYVGGGGQEAMRGDELLHPLQVGASNGKGPLSGAVVKFEVQEGEGHLQPSGGQGSGTGSIEVVTGLDGIAECFWTLGIAGRQRVKATLRGEDGNQVHLPIFFNSGFVIDPNDQLRMDICKFGLAVSVLGMLGSFIGFVWLGSKLFPLFVLFAFAAMFFGSMGMRRWE